MQRELIIHSDQKMIVQVEEFIEQMRDELHVKEDVYGNIVVAVTEAVNNSIIHGNRSDQAKTVKVDFISDSPYHLIIRVRDEGQGFDPMQLPDPTAPENIENPGGRGVFLMKCLSDEIEFKDYGRSVEMHFNI